MVSHDVKVKHSKFCYRIQNKKLINGKINEEIWRKGFESYIKIEPSLKNNKELIFFCKIGDEYKEQTSKLIEKTSKYSFYKVNNSKDIYRNSKEIYDDPKILIYVIDKIYNNYNINDNKITFIKRNNLTPVKFMLFDEDI